MKFFAEIGTAGGSSSGFNPLSFDSHLTHIFSNGTLRSTFSGFAEFFGDFRSTMVRVRIVIDMLDLLLIIAFLWRVSETL